MVRRLAAFCGQHTCGAASLGRVIQDGDGPARTQVEALPTQKALSRRGTEARAAAAAAKTLQGEVLPCGLRDSDTNQVTRYALSRLTIPCGSR